ncbi:MAG TPA: hypothetical protein VKF82_03435 [Candidatus Eremiobacteraceae bacterium]|nr:hypothetical protein [Candidatus Eremiobacteraceae bacterium]
MTLEALNTAAAIGTFLVITASAIAALVQLRHLRTSNQLSGLITVFGMLQDPSVRELVNFVRHELAERMKDDDFRASLLEIPIDRRKHPEFYLCDMYNHIGSFVRSGLIDERTYLQTDWFNVNLYWNLLADGIAITRTNRPHVFENFEYLAARAKAWADEHPDGDYPSNERRML